MITWRYVKPLNNAEAVTQYGTKSGMVFDSAFIECATQNNGGRPSANVFDTDNTKERTIKSLLSFNEGDVENIFKNNDVLNKETVALVAFAIDSFGNYICFSKDSGSVVLYDFESGIVERIADSFLDFVGKLR